MTSSSCRKRGDRGRQGFLLHGTGSSALGKKRRKAGKDCTVGLAVKEPICRKSVYTHQLIDERLMSMCFELTGECAAVNLVDAPTEAILNAELKEVFWKKLVHLVKQIPKKELLFLVIDANARTGK